VQRSESGAFVQFIAPPAVQTDSIAAIRLKATKGFRLKHFDLRWKENVV
jgi:hypothetical protein